MGVEISIEDFNAGQLEQLTELFGAYYQPGDRLLTKSYNNWLYADNPFGLARMVKAVEGCRWIGFMAMIPVHLVRKDAEVVAYYVVNVLVHPEYQGKNIFGRMITSAKELVIAENAVIMGHPNDMALKAWQCAGMHFHDLLTPSLVVPSLRANNVRARDVSDVRLLEASLTSLKEQARRSQRWSPRLSAEYISWRYLLHPANVYRMQLIEVNAAPAGFIVSRKVRRGLNLLVDQFMLDCFVAEGLSRLPWFTIAFMTKSFTRELPGWFWRLPVQKKIHFFCTYYQQPFAAGDVMGLGLSASDF
jgi:GNAT superfamily N-acetyltransferase